MVAVGGLEPPPAPSKGVYGFRVRCPTLDDTALKLHRFSLSTHSIIRKTKDKSAGQINSIRILHLYSTSHSRSPIYGEHRTNWNLIDLFHICLEIAMQTNCRVLHLLEGLCRNLVSSYQSQLHLALLSWQLCYPILSLLFEIVDVLAQRLQLSICDLSWILNHLLKYRLVLLLLPSNRLHCLYLGVGDSQCFLPLRLFSKPLPILFFLLALLFSLLRLSLSLFLPSFLLLFLWRLLWLYVHDNLWKGRIHNLAIF